MPDLPDIHCWIKLVDKSTGKAVPSGFQFSRSADVIVRYVVANDSHLSAGPLAVVGRLWKNGVLVQPAGKPNVVPAQEITVQPNQIWKAEYEVNDTPTKVVDVFDASMVGDIGNIVNEEDENNNWVSADFAVVPILT